MAFIKTIPEERAEGKLLELYKADRQTKGYVPNHTAAFSLRPEVYDAWQKLLGAIRGNMRLRRYELVTFAVASELGCTYCKLAHGAVLRENVLTSAELEAVARDFRSAGLAPAEVAIMEFAQKLTRQASSITPADVEGLRGHGLTDAEILDVVLAATARNFMSKTLDAVGAEPDAVYEKMEPALHRALVGPLRHTHGA
jgi:uncharacterized peroxidase-related enzyme